MRNELYQLVLKTNASQNVYCVCKANTYGTPTVSGNSGCKPCPNNGTFSSGTKTQDGCQQASSGSSCTNFNGVSVNGQCVSKSNTYGTPTNSDQCGCTPCQNLQNSMQGSTQSSACITCPDIKGIIISNNSTPICVYQTNTYDTYTNSSDSGFMARQFSCVQKKWDINNTTPLQNLGGFNSKYLHWKFQLGFKNLS
ncbi:hypothetical protein ABPG73_021936 [Tetrahymena malaccensis]